MMVKFCKGEEIVTSFSAVTAGIKIAGDFDGSYVAQDNAPSESGDDAFVFQFDLSTAGASAYFTANPTAETANAVRKCQKAPKCVTRKTGVRNR